MLGGIAEVAFCIGQFGAVLGLQLFLLWRPLTVVMCLTDNVLLTVDKGRQFVECLVGLAALPARHLQDIFTKRTHLQEIDFGAKSVGLLSCRAGVISH